MKRKTFFIASFFLLCVSALLWEAAGCRKAGPAGLNSGTDSSKEENTGNTESTENKKGAGNALNIRHARGSEDIKPLTEADVRSFAQTLEERLKQGDAAFFVRSVDWSELTDCVLAGIQTHEAENGSESGAASKSESGLKTASESGANAKSDIHVKPVPKKELFDRRYLIQLFSEKGGIAQSVAEKVQQGGSYHFLRTRKNEDGTWAATFRLVDADGGLDYHDLYLERRGGNLIQIREFYLYHFDETFSETLRRTLVPDLYVDGKNDYGMPMPQLIRILYKENELLIQEMSKAFESGNYIRTLDLFERLPKELQGLKTFQFWRLKVAQLHPDLSVYPFILADVRQKFHQEGWVDFLSLDYFFNHHEYSQALECIERIDALVGGDPYLNNFRCWAYMNLRKPEEAEKLYSDAVTREPVLAQDVSFQSVRKRLDLIRNQKMNEVQNSESGSGIRPDSDSGFRSGSDTGFRSGSETGTEFMPLRPLNPFHTAVPDETPASSEN